MSEVTQILHRIETGDPSAANQLLPLIYHELKRLAASKMAKEPSDHTLQATALVHEAFVRLVDVPDAQRWDSRNHFLAAASEAMRRVLVEGARRKNSIKGGGRLQRQADDVDKVVPSTTSVNVVELDDALTRLGEEKPAVAKLVELRYFAGLTVEEAAAAMGVTSRTANNYWAYAKSWLHQELGGEA